jgi:hypothetical protein
MKWAEIVASPSRRWPIAIAGTQGEQDRRDMRRHVGSLILLAISVAGAAHAGDDAKQGSFHIGVGYAALVFPTLQAQLEWPSWFLGAELGWGFGGWGLSSIALAKVGYVYSASGHYLAIGAGIGSAYDTENASGSGFALSGETGLMLGYGRSWGRIVPYIEIPVATWTATSSDRRYTWRPGAGLLLGVKLLY